MASILDQIVADKRAEVDRAKQARSLPAVADDAAAAERPRNLFSALTGRRGGTRAIAEVKRASPSAGTLREDMDPVAIARAYERGGASAVSCLTDAKYFQGSLDDLSRIKQAVSLPVLRKDFIIDPYQVYEARAAGADAILLIAECLTESHLLDLLILATQLQLTTLIEVHDVESLLRVRPHIGFPHEGYFLLGINNRDLRTMTTDINQTTRLVEMAERRDIVVSESGIHSRGDVHHLRSAGVRIILVGEHLMQQPDPGEALRALLS